MSARTPRRKAPATPVQAPLEQAWGDDAADELQAFAAAPDSVTPTDQEPPELVWLDASDGLDDFGPEFVGLPLVTAAASTHGDEAEASSLMAVPVPPPEVDRAWLARDVSSSDPSQSDWMKRAGRAALLCAVVVAVTDGILLRHQPAAPQLAGRASQPAAEAPATDAPIERALPPLVADPPPVGPAVVRTASSQRRSVEDRESLLRPGELSTIGPPDVVPQRLSEPPAAEAGSRILPDTAVAAATFGPDAPLSASASATAVALPMVVAEARAAVSPAAETSRAESPGESTDTGVGAPGRELETRAIENVLSQYRSAFNRLDASAALAVWPSADEKNLSRAFDRLEDQDVSFESCRIEILAVLAEAACSGTSRYVPKVGSRTPKAEARRWTFSLRKATAGWLIDRVHAR